MAPAALAKAYAQSIFPPGALVSGRPELKSLTFASVVAGNLALIAVNRSADGLSAPCGHQNAILVDRRAGDPGAGARYLVPVAHFFRFARPPVGLFLNAFAVRSLVTVVSLARHVGARVSNMTCNQGRLARADGERTGCVSGSRTSGIASAGNSQALTVGPAADNDRVARASSALPVPQSPAYSIASSWDFSVPRTCRSTMICHPFSCRVRQRTSNEIIGISAHVPGDWVDTLKINDFRHLSHAISYHLRLDADQPRARSTPANSCGSGKSLRDRSPAVDVDQRAPSRGT